MERVRISASFAVIARSARRKFRPVCYQVKAPGHFLYPSGFGFRQPDTFLQLRYPPVLLRFPRHQPRAFLCLGFVLDVILHQSVTPFAG